MSTGLSLFLSTPTLLSDPSKEKMDMVQSMKVGIRVGVKKSCQANLEKMTKKTFVINSNKRLFTQLYKYFSSNTANGE